MNGRTRVSSVLCLALLLAAPSSAAPVAPGHRTAAARPIPTTLEYAPGQIVAIAKEGVLDPLANVERFARGAEAAEERADVGILAELKDGDCAEDERDGETKHSGHGAAPLHLAFLKAFQFLDHPDGALDLRHGAAFGAEQGLDGSDEFFDAGGLFVPAKQSRIDVAEAFGIRRPALRDEKQLLGDERLPDAGGALHDGNIALALEGYFDQGIFGERFGEINQGSIGGDYVGEEWHGFLVVAHHHQVASPWGLGAGVELSQADFIAEFAEWLEAVRPNLIWEDFRVGTAEHFAGDDCVDTEIFKASAEVALEEIKRDEDHGGDRDQQAPNKNAGEDATGLFQPARPSVLPEVGND